MPPELTSRQQAILDTISQLDKTKVEVVGLDTLVAMVRKYGHP